MPEEKDLDVVVFGATGLTGRAVCAHLDRHGAGLRWAAAGRSAERVRQVLAHDGVVAPEIVVADVADPASLAAMAERSRVVLNLVGPYTDHGPPVVEACVDAGAHHLDLAGEIPFVRRMIDRFDAPAHAAGVALVGVCGFEALPPDLAVAALSEAARGDGRRLVTVDTVFDAVALPPRPRPSDVVSGGTFQSLLASVGDDGARAIPDPAALLDDPGAIAAVRRVSPITLAPRLEGTDVVAAQVPGPFIDPAVLHRSAVDRAAAHGEAFVPFRFREGIGLRGGVATLPLRLAAAAAIAAPQVLFRALATVPPDGVRRAVAGRLAAWAPDSGFGPALDRLDAFRWRLSIRAGRDDGRSLTMTVSGDGHPGYRTTATALAEAGMALAERGPSDGRGGYRTPAGALGVADLDRFDRAGLRFGPVTEA